MGKILSRKRQIFELLIKSAHAAYSLSFNGQSECLTNASKFFGNPDIGDLVMETTTIGRKTKDSRANIGRLLRIEKDPGGNSYCDKWIIKCLYNDREFAWHNAHFIRVLDLGESFYDILHAVESNNER